MDPTVKTLYVTSVQGSSPLAWWLRTTNKENCKIVTIHNFWTPWLDTNISNPMAWLQAHGQGK